MKRILALVFVFSIANLFVEVDAATVNSGISVTGDFNASLGGSGSATLNSASGNFKQWVPGPFGTGFHLNVGVSAPGQTVGINIPTVNPPTFAASGAVNMDYDNVTPGTPQTINSVNADLNGSANVGFNINVDPISVNTSLGNFNLNLTVNGNITDISFASSGPANVIGGNGGNYAVPGDFTIVLDGTVNAVLSGVPIIGTVNLGTITTIPSSPLSFAAFLPGTVTTTDLDGGVGPFPNDMNANFQADLGALALPVPFSLPINLNESNSIPNGQSGFDSLVVNADLDATLELSNISYNLDGQVQAALIPEPSSGLFLAGLVAGAGAVIRRRRS